MANTKALLVSVSALALVPTVASAATRHAKHPVKHAVKKDSTAEELRALREQIADLSTRLGAAEAAQRESVANVASAQAQAAAADRKASAAATQASAVSAQATDVQTKVAAVETKPAKPAAAKWYDGTSISGRMFFNVSHISQTSDGKGVARSTAFDIKRFYFGVDHKFNDVFSANMTTDVILISNTNTVTGTAANAAAATPAASFGKGIGETLFLKNAYLQASLSRAVNFRVGEASLPWIGLVEDLYGYRFVENTLIDRTGFGTSADWGVHAFGSLADGHITYAAAVIDGAGFRNPLRSKTMDIEARIAVNYAGFTAAVGGYTGKRAGNTDTPFSPANATVTPVQTGVDLTPQHQAKRFDAVLAYVSPKLRVGGEYFWTKNWNRVMTAGPDDTSDGYTFWASYAVYKNWSVFGRYDHTKPSKDLFPNITDKYFNVGINFEPTKIVDLALVYKHDRVDNGYFAPTNSNPANFAWSIGGQNHGVYEEIGLWGQLRF